MPRPLAWINVKDRANGSNTTTWIFIEDLFRDEWLSKSDAYGFHESLDGEALREIFHKYKNDYCGLFLGPFLNHNCSVNGNVIVKKLSTNYKITICFL